MNKLPFSHSNCKPHNWLVYRINSAFLAQLIGNIKGNLYDLGCGEMPYREWLLNYAETYTGVDWGSTLHPLKADIVADLNHPLPIQNSVADSVISLSVIEHLCEPQLFLTEAYRILKPGGAMVLQVPFMWQVHETPHDYFRYTRYGLKYMFEKSGFQEIDILPQTGFWVMFALKFNYQTTRLIGGPWLIRAMLSGMMRFVWGITQHLATFLDKYWKCEDETAGYFVVAKRL